MVKRSPCLFSESHTQNIEWLISVKIKKELYVTLNRASKDNWKKNYGNHFYYPPSEYIVWRLSGNTKTTLSVKCTS